MPDSPQYTPVPPQAAQSSGLTDNNAGALAYVTIIPAIIFLLIEPYNRNSFVRFHAWQCIFLGITSIAIHLVLGVIPVIGWFMMPFASLGILIVWIIALVKALKGERYELPIIGKFAAQQAGS
jgi:uncharacterized membrane protein